MMFVAILFLGGSCFSFVLSGIYSEAQEEGKSTICSVLAAVLMIAFILTIGPLFQEEGYKKGQIDALSGTVKYELVEQENKELIWKEINE